VWIDLLLQKKSLPSVLAPDLLCWLTVSWVFKKAAPFKEVSSLLTMLGDENMGGEALQVLPVPGRIVENLNNRRVSLLEHVFKNITILVERYQKSKAICQRPEDLRGSLRFACDAMVLGTLLRSCITANMWAIPLYAYHGVTVQATVSKSVH